MSDKRFTAQEQQLLLQLLMHRRDVRGNRFVEGAVSDEALQQILGAATMAPSVGYSQPWEFIVIRNRTTKQAIADVFEQENVKAQALFKNDKAKQYSKLKLECISATPVNVAVFYKPSTAPILGQTSMQEAGEYSVVCAVQNMWLMSRAMNIGMGWVSILDVDKVKAILNAPQEHKLVAYLCLGQVDEFLHRPELEQLMWEKHKPLKEAIIYERYGSP